MLRNSTAIVSTSQLSYARPRRKNSLKNGGTHVIGDSSYPLNETQIDVREAVNFAQIATDTRSADEMILFAAVQLYRKNLSRSIGDILR